MKKIIYLFALLTFNFQLSTINCLAQSQWQRTIGGSSDVALSIIQTTDGGYAAAGYTYSFGAGNADFYIVKLNASGSLQWMETVGRGNYELALSIIQTSDGGYAVAGDINSSGAGLFDMYIVKLNASGSLQWNKTIGGADNDVARSIIQTADGGYALAGYTGSFGAGIYDMYIVKLDASGSLQWNKTIGGAGYDLACSIIQTTDGGYAAASYTNSFGAGLYDIYIVKLDTSGSLQWSKTIGGTSNDSAYSIIQTPDGGYAVAGHTFSFGAGNTDMYIVKLDASGTLQWSKTVGRIGEEYAWSIIQTTDGGYAAAGYTGYTLSHGMYIVKLDASGNTCGNSTSPTSTVTSPTSTVNTPTPTVTSPISTVTTPTPIMSSGGTLIADCLVGIQPLSNEIPSSYSLSQNYPNPFNPATVISYQLPVNSFVTLKVYDILGREIAVLVNEELKRGTYQVEFDGSNYPSGVYFYHLIAGGFAETKRMILIK